MTIIDTSIVILFGIIQACMMAALSARDSTGIYIWIFCGLALGAGAYYRAYYCMSEDYVACVLKNYYGDQFDSVYPRLKTYTWNCWKVTRFFAVLFLVVTILGWLVPHGSVLYSLISIILVAIYLWVWDAKRWLQDQTKWDKLLPLGHNSSTTTPPKEAS